MMAASRLPWLLLVAFGGRAAGHRGLGCDTLPDALSRQHAATKAGTPGVFAGAGLRMGLGLLLFDTAGRVAPAGARCRDRGRSRGPGADAPLVGGSGLAALDAQLSGAVPAGPTGAGPSSLPVASTPAGGVAAVIAPTGHSGSQTAQSMHDEEIRALVKTVHRADIDAVGVFALDAVLQHDVGHQLTPRTIAGRTIGDLEKCLPWHLSRRKDENVVFAFLHFQ
jgi:hypothetical protein